MSFVETCPAPHLSHLDDGARSCFFTGTHLGNLAYDLLAFVDEDGDCFYAVLDRGDRQWEEMAREHLRVVKALYPCALGIPLTELRAMVGRGNRDVWDILTLVLLRAVRD